MRICLVSNEVMPFVGGGIATYAVEMARALLGEGHEVHILTQGFEGLRERGQEFLPGVVYHAYDASRGLASLPGAYYSVANRASMSVRETLRELHARTPFDYIEFPEYRGEGYWSLRAKRTLGELADAVLGVRLHTPHYLCMEMDRSFALSVENAHIEHMEKQSVRECDLLLGASRAVLDRVRRDAGAALPGAACPPHRLLRLPLDLARLADAGGPGAPPASPSHMGPKTILYFGRLQTCKGTHVLARAALGLLARGEDVHFRFIGGDTITGPFGRSMREHLERLVKGPHRDRFRFEPAVDRGALAREIRSAWACCFPSLWESYSYACVEALALGACVVTSDGGALGEIVQHEQSGLVCAHGDAGALEAQLLRVLRDEPLRQRLAAAAPARAAALSNSRVIAQELVDTVHERRRELASTKITSTPTTPDAPDASVVIPFYNVGKYLPETLTSLNNQSVRGFELLIIDDGSDEPESLDLLRRLRRGGLRVISKPNGGLGSARNAGFHEARGEWILPVDADDVCREDYIATFLGVIRRNPSLAFAAAFFESFYEKPGERVSGYIPLAPDPDLLGYHNIAGPGACAILHRETVLSVGGYDEWLTSYEDWDLWCTLLERGHRGTILPEALLYYRLRQGSLIRSEALPRAQALRAYLLAKHPRMAGRPDITARLILGEAFEKQERVALLEQQVRELQERLIAAQGHAEIKGPAGEAPALGEGVDASLVRSEAYRMIRSNIRYRLADRLNDALKAVGVHRTVKGMAQRAIRARGPRR